MIGTAAGTAAGATVNTAAGAMIGAGAAGGATAGIAAGADSSLAAHTARLSAALQQFGAAAPLSAAAQAGGDEQRLKALHGGAAAGLLAVPPR
jgi:hypothetical protein